MPEKAAEAMAIAMFNVAIKHDDEVRKLKQRIQQLEYLNKVLLKETFKSHKELDDQEALIESLRAQLKIANSNLYRVLVGK